MNGAPAAVRTERRGAVAVLTVDNPPVNAMSQGLRSALGTALDQALADPAVAALVLIGAGRTFIAGADISEFGKPRAEPLTPTLIAKIEAGGKPVVAALHGTPLGGGLELAMGCHFRVALPDTKLGQPEVKLGILPGAGGTQRLPRLVGLPLALDMIAGGEPIGAAQALDCGLIDALIPGELRAGAIAFAETVLREKRPLRIVRDLPPTVPPSPDFFAAYRADLAKRKRGLIAPQHCARAVEASTLPFDEGMARERALFAELVAGDQSKALRHFFFAEREANKIPDLPRDTPVADIRKVAVIGAGTMGGGIAMCFANVGIPVAVIEASEEALQRGLATVRRNYDSSAKRGGLTPADVERRLGLIQGSVAYADLADADLVIEAAFEDLALKKEIFARLDRTAKPGAILATNTSYLDVDAIAAATGRPEKVLGLHFFSPANIMRLVEVVRGAQTDKPTIATAMALAKKIRKVPVLVGVCDGFVGNRMLTLRGQEAERLLLDGATPQQVDAAMVEFGFPMGPFAASDLAGLDIGFRARQARGLDWPLADALSKAGRLGQKNQKGYYRYESGNRTPLPDPEVEAMIDSVARARGNKRAPIATEEIVPRLVYPMINEGARILAEGIALRPGDIDVVWVYGYGWPAYRGGPMFHGEQVGLAVIRDKLTEFAARFGDVTLEPAPLLAKRAAALRFGETGE